MLVGKRCKMRKRWRSCVTRVQNITGQQCSTFRGKGLHRVSYLNILMTLMHHYWWLLFIENFRNIGSKTCKQNFLIRNKFQVLKGFHTVQVPVLSSYSCLLLHMRLVWDQQAEFEFIDSNYGGKTSGHWFGHLTTRLTRTNPKPLQTSIDIPWLRILCSL